MLYFKVNCSGTGLRSGVRAEVPQEFMIDCKEAGIAPLDVVVKGPDGSSCSFVSLLPTLTLIISSSFTVTGETENVVLRDNGNGTHMASYTPSNDGPYLIQIKYGNEEIPQSPYRVLALPKHDASKVIKSLHCPARKVLNFG